MSRISVFRISLLVVTCFTANSWGAVYYSGVDGIKATLFDTSFADGGGGCAGCHNYDGVRNFTVSYDLFKTVADTKYTGADAKAKRQALIYEMYRRTGLAPGSTDFMPNGGAANISSAQRTKLWNWRSGGGLNHAVPSKTTNSSITNKGKVSQVSNLSAFFTVSASVNDNGVNDTDYSFQYGKTQTAEFTSGTQQVSGSGTISQALPGLQCGITYYFRVKAYSSTYVNSYGSWQSTNTSACNTPPIIQSNLTAVNATEDQSFTLDIDVTDDTGSEGNGISYALTTYPAGMSINTSTGIISWTPTEGIVQGDYTVNVTVTAEDSGYDNVTKDSESFSIAVTAVNDNPIISPIANTSAVEGNEYSYQVVVTDPDVGHILSNHDYALTNFPSGMAISTSGLITWTPGNGITTSGIVGLTVTDLAAAFDSINFTLGVSATNTSPTITSSAVTTADEGTPYEYTVVVSDIDDPDIENEIDFTLSNAPSGMEVSNGGVITWTPPEDQADITNMSVTAADGGENGVPAATQTFTITVNKINNSPQLVTPIPAQTLNETQALSLDVSTNFNDVDTLDIGLNWSLTGEPSGMDISNNGVITWDTPQDSANTYNITITLTDDGSNGAQAATDTLTVNILFLDTDLDTVADYNDNCPDVSNTDQANNENDSQGDVCDLDDDNDTIPDSIENALGLDSFDASDASIDTDGDGVSNAQEYANCLTDSDTSCSRILNDTTPPVITTNGDQELISTGYLTPAILTATAQDDIAGETLVVADKLGPFRPGANVVTWTSYDTVGNIGTHQQAINILPHVRFGGSKQTGEGTSINVPLTLSGDSPSYPVMIEYSVSGSSDENDHDLTSGQIEITNGTQASLTVNIIDDGLIEIDETLIISLSSATNNVALGESLVYDIQIAANNLAPELLLQVEQHGEAVPVVFQDQGLFRVSAVAEDGNGDALTYSWEEADERLNLGGSVAIFDIDPASLEAGFYEIVVEVSDGQANVSQQLGLNIKALAPVLDGSDSDGDGLSDQDEGLVDADGDGVLDYLDPVNDVQQLHQSLTSSDSQDLMKTEPGYRLKVGQLSIESNSNGAKLGSQYISPISDTQAGKVLSGDILDFEIQGTSELNPMARVVIPLSNPIAEGAEYWKLDGDNWYQFNQSGNDYLASSQRVNGVCPEALSELYTVGLTPFDECLLLVIEDGGPNDSDGKLNGVVRDPGSLAVPKTESFIAQKNQLAVPTESPGGAGVLNSKWILLLLIFFALLRIRQHKSMLNKALS
jgi:hypothetical protein